MRAPQRFAACPREKLARDSAHFSLTQWAGGVTDEHGAVRRRRSEFDSRPACHFLLLTVLENDGKVEIEFSNDTQAPLRLLYHAGRRNAARSGKRYVHVTGASIYAWFLRPPIQNRGPFSFCVHFVAPVAASSNGQDAVLSRLRWEFDSPRCYQEFVCLK